MKQLSYLMLIIGLSPALLNAAPVSKEDAEKAIMACEGFFAQSRESRKKIEQLKEPGLFSSSLTKKLYQNRNLHLKAFDDIMKDFIGVTNNKINIRIAKNDDERGDVTQQYKRQCADLALLLSHLVTFATTDQMPKDPAMTKQVQTAISFAKCGKFTCP